MIGFSPRKKITSLFGNDWKAGLIKSAFLLSCDYSNRLYLSAENLTLYIIKKSLSRGGTMAKKSLKSIVYGIKEVYTNATKDAEVITYGNIEPKLEAALNSGSSGGAELNISYGETEPTDTSKLWIKANEPHSIKFSKDIDGVNSLSVIGALNDSSMSCARVGTKIYLFGGNSSGTQIHMFDTETETLTTLDATFSTPVFNAGCASV